VWSGYTRGSDWCMDLLATYIRNSELQVITAPPLNSTIHKSPQHPLSLFPDCCLFTSCSLVTASNSEDSSASFVQVLTSQTLVQNSLSTDLVLCLQHLGKDHVETRRFNCFIPTVALFRICCLATGTCLPSRFPETVTLYRVAA
jgi:hypothetical protein